MVLLSYEFFYFGILSDMSEGEVTKAYRPIGPKELQLIEQNGFKCWPPRLPEQPFFYPVTNERYAIEIARDWNAKTDGVGYVTCFNVKKNFLNKYEVHVVGASYHTEWWIPSGDLGALNDNIIGLIEIIGEYRK